MPFPVHRARPRARESAFYCGLMALCLIAGCGRTAGLVFAGGGESSSSGGNDTSTSSSSGSSGPTVDPDTTGSSSDTQSTETTSVPIECGNGILEPGEQCDPGQDAIGPDQQCVPGCVLNICGDAMPGPAEQCDDGNGVDQDECTSACQLATCGDGFVWTGVEQCDDGDGDDDDACHNDCTPAFIVSVSAGGNHTCALVDNGSVRCWGNGNNGRTGLSSVEVIGDDEPASEAAAIALGGPVVRLVAGLSHTCVRYSEGVVRCFGRSAEGQLGYGALDDVGDDEAPGVVPFVPLGGTVATLTTGSGSFHGCAQFDDGDVRCWGQFEDGRLGSPGLIGPVGDDEPASDAIPVDAGAPIAAMSTGAEHSCARLVGGQIRCWGSNASGQLGSGQPFDIGDDETPGSLPPVSVGGPVADVVAGWFHTCARFGDGSVRCWGRGNNGRLGLGNTSWIGINDTPADHPFVDVGGFVVQLAAGNAHTCALLDTGAVRCWGWGAQGQLGYGNTVDIGDDESPSAAGDVPLGGGATQITAGANHTCALLVGGRVRCWGNGGDGRLGYGTVANVGDDEAPADVGDLPILPQ